MDKDSSVHLIYRDSSDPIRSYPVLKTFNHLACKLKGTLEKSCGRRTSIVTGLLMYRSNRSFNMPPPPPGIPRAFDTFAVAGRREFDYQSLQGGGEFDSRALGVGNLKAFELHPRLHVKSLAW